MSPCKLETSLCHACPQKGAKEHVENYRPISLLAVVSKVFEHCVLNSIRFHLYQVISPKQHGFCTGRSCITNLLEALDHIGSLLDSGSQVDTIYLNMSKAFNKVSHRRLIHKLIQVGFGGNLLNWFCSYLSSQRQCVTVLSSSSRVLMFADDTNKFRDKDFEGCLSSTGRPWESCNLVSIIWSPF